MTKRRTDRTPADRPIEEIHPDERLDAGQVEKRTEKYRRMGPVGFWRWWIAHEQRLPYREWIVARTYREWVISTIPRVDLQYVPNAATADWFSMEQPYIPTCAPRYDDKRERYKGVYHIGCFKVDELKHADGSQANCRRVFITHGDTMWEKHPAVFFDHEGPGTWVSLHDYATYSDGEGFAQSMLSDLLSYLELQRQHRIDFIEV